MTELVITPKISDKTARFKGAVAAGEHVAVTVKGAADWLGDDNGAHLSLRVLDMVTGRTLAVFPRPEDTLDAGETPDEWSVSQEDANDIFCNLNLNTTRMVAAARHMLRVPVLFVMGAKDEDDPATTRTLYFRDRYEVEFWPERVGDDTPYDLDKWPKKIDEWTDLVTDWNRRMNAMKLSAQRVPRTESSVGKVTITLNDGNAETDTVVDVFDGADGEVTAAQLNNAIAGVNASIGNVADGLDAHAGNGDIHVTATQKAAWTAKYDKPSGGIPKSDLASGVQASLGKADTALQAHQSLDAYVNGGSYDSTNKKILLKHGSTTIAEIDATAFIKDGMVDGVEVSGGNLVISFNTDAGIEDIEIPLTDIFNPANYYDKTTADGRFVHKEAGKGLFSGSYDDLTDKPTIPPAVTVDDTVTRPSANPVKSSGIWSAIWGALTALPTGFASLYDWCVAQLAGKLSGSGETYTFGESLGGLFVNVGGTTDSYEFSPASLGGANTIVRRKDIAGMYEKPSGGIPATDLAQAVQAALAAIPGKADAADLRYRIAEAVLTAKLPASAFPIEYTDSTATPTSRTIMSADDVYFVSIAGHIYAHDKNNPDYGGADGNGFANFDATSGVYESKDAPIESLSFNGSATATLDFAYTIADRTVNLITAQSGIAASIDIELPSAVTVDGVRYCRDFILDVDNSANASDLALEFTSLGVSYAFVPLEDDSVSEMMTIGAGERVRLYFTETPYMETGSLPVINVARVTLGDFVTSTTTQGGN